MLWWESSHWLPAFLYLDEELLLDTYSDIRGKLPKELSQARKGGWDWGIQLGGTWTRAWVLKRIIYLDDLINSLHLEKPKSLGIDEGRLVVAFVRRRLTVSRVDKDKDLVIATMGRDDPQAWLRFGRLDFAASRTKDGEWLTDGIKWNNCLVIGVKAPGGEAIIKPICVVSLDRCEALKTRGKTKTHLDKVINNAQEWVKAHQSSSKPSGP